jgi:hypothetical protein
MEDGRQYLQKNQQLVTSPLEKWIPAAVDGELVPLGEGGIKGGLIFKIDNYK